MYQISDSDSSDSEDGIRYKTESTRNKNTSDSRTRHHEGSRSHRVDTRDSRGSRYSRRSPSPFRKYDNKRYSDRDRRTRRSKSPNRKNSRSRSREPYNSREPYTSREQHKSRKSKSRSKTPNSSIYNVERNDRDNREKIKKERSIKEKEDKEHDSMNKRLKDGDSKKECRRKHRDRHETTSNTHQRNKESSSSRDSVIVDASDKKSEQNESKSFTTPHDVSSKSSSSSVNNKRVSNSSVSLNPDEKANEDKTNGGCSVENPKESVLLGPSLPPRLDKQLENTTDEIVGPKLPPHMLQQKVKETISKDSKTCIQNESIDIDIKDVPLEPIGPALPPHLLKKNELQGKNIAEESVPKSEVPIGPALPPHLLAKKTEDPSIDNSDPNNDTGALEVETNQTSEPLEALSIGPALPPHLREKLAAAATSEVDEIHSEEDPDVYGPLPPGIATNSQAHIALEERALQMKIDGLNPTDDSKKGREEWMLELPKVRAAGLGLTSRQFRPNAGPDMSDRTSWTDTPEEKEKKLAGKVETKVDLQKEAELLAIQRRDEEQEEMAKRHKKKKKRDKSLLEQHQEKLEKKKKKEKDAGDNVRRPFSRDIDLKVNQFDDAQKKAILKKAALLDDRFSRGQSKFL